LQAVTKAFSLQNILLRKIYLLTVHTMQLSNYLSWPGFQEQASKQLSVSQVWQKQ